jgi:hypothetical protein
MDVSIMFEKNKTTRQQASGLQEFPFCPKRPDQQLTREELSMLDDESDEDEGDEGDEDDKDEDEDEEKEEAGVQLLEALNRNRGLISDDSGTGEVNFIGERGFDHIDEGNGNDECSNDSADEDDNNGGVADVTAALKMKLGLPHGTRAKRGSHLLNDGASTIATFENTSFATSSAFRRNLQDDIDAATFAAPISPRSKYLVGCLKENIIPRAALITRRKVSHELNLQHLGKLISW